MITTGYEYSNLLVLFFLICIKWNRLELWCKILLSHHCVVREGIARHGVFMRIIFLIFFTLISAQIKAQIYECKDSKGNVSFQDMACTTDKKQKKLEPEVKAEENYKIADEQWALSKSFDLMTEMTACVIQSPLSFVGSHNSDLLFVRVRVAITKEGYYVVGLYSDDPLAKEDTSIPLFHNNIDGVGIKVEPNGFIDADQRYGDRVIGFSLEKSSLIVNQLNSGKFINVRVRYWPYEKTYDGYAISLKGFNSALDDLKKCEISG